ncbi:MAG TPA: SDR family NAD(P)-dependent oxidoreductase, partial [Acidimicrobiales bacterium]|nr:SDR family NAD(P)-dependent oxidoreductase [Acidimicrobiales bacterium]
MELRDKVIVVTGGASGIGRALCLRFAAEAPTGIVVADLNGAGAEATAEAVGRAGAAAMAVPTDVGQAGDIAALVRAAEDRFGPVDLFCSNAGIAVGGGPEAPDEQWQKIWDVNLMAHVWA